MLDKKKLKNAFIKCGLKKNDHVLVPSLSWVSTFTAVKSLQAIPIGVEVDNDFILSFNDIKKKTFNS